VGAGGPREATFALIDAIPAGTWTLVADGIITASVDVTFEILWRRGATEQPIASWQQHFDPRGGGNFDAQPFEESAAGPAVEYAPGDLLVLRYDGEGTNVGMAYIPNGDGAEAAGRIPYIRLP
jgi:hypothetical protein